MEIELIDEISELRTPISWAWRHQERWPAAAPLATNGRPFQRLVADAPSTPEFGGIDGGVVDFRANALGVGQAASQRVGECWMSEEVGEAASRGAGWVGHQSWIVAPA